MAELRRAGPREIRCRRASLACRVSPRDLRQYCRYCLAVLPPARAPTPRRAKLWSGWGPNDGARAAYVRTFVMPRFDPIPALKQQLGAELARLLVGWNADDVAVLIGTDRPRISELRRGKVSTGSRSRRRSATSRDPLSRRARAGARSASLGNTARQYRQYCQRLRGGHRRALDPRDGSYRRARYGAPDARRFALSFATERISENSGRVRGGAAIEADKNPTKSETYSGGDWLVRVNALHVRRTPG